jgi:PAS domain S-box-containing protein
MKSKSKTGTDNPQALFPIVAIGASAGGLPALESFLSALPDGFGFVLIFMQHLSAKHKNILPELLRSRTTGLLIEEATDGADLVPGKLYLCPPAREIRIENNTFRVASRSRPHMHLPIDELLLSLSLEAQDRTVAVILSGAGTDGARGVQAVRKAGGTVFIQDPATAEYPAMPLAAINTGQIDGVLTPDNIAREILKFHRSGMVSVAVDEFMGPAEFDSLFRLVDERTGHHFNHYKKNVINRRVRRRMYLHGISSIQDYLKLLAGKDSEASQLASDLMIGVTSFFRDHLAWKALHLEVTRKLIAEEDNSPIRVWTPACATGEEAYSIAMMLEHELDLASRRREIQVFATDVNDLALERAREGLYPATISADLPPDYVKKFFSPVEDGLSLSVNKDIRQQVVFAKHDLLTDPPFSRLDLVICRNLLIYLETDAQEKCIALFHYALKKHGFLFLGNAESPGRNSPLFLSLAHKKCRIYRKAEASSRVRMPLSIPFVAERPLSSSKQKPLTDHGRSLTQLIQDALLEEHAPAAVAINQNYDILYHNGPTNRYLHQPRGTPTQNFLELLPERLRNRIRGALYRATQEAKPVVIRTSITNKNERKKQVLISSSKLRENLFLITFREKGNAPDETNVPFLETANIEEMVVRQLENELSSMRDDLQSHIEQLKSLNEELESSNEELQAANEELETSREELQSLNEELTTVNAQLQTKIEEQEETNNDLNNFLTSTNIPTIFLDLDLKVKRFTLAMSRLVTLIPADMGRPIVDMSQINLGPDFIADARSVIDSLTPIGKELPINGVWYIRTTLPYRTADNRIEGVVITYNDITEIKGVEKALEESRRRLSVIVDSIADGFFAMDREWHITHVNDAALKHFGKTRDEMVGHTLFKVFPHARGTVFETEYSRAMKSREPVHFETSSTISDRTLEVHVYPGPDNITVLFRDITDRKQAEEIKRHLASFPELNPNPVMEVDASGELTYCNPGAYKILEDLGMTREDWGVLLPNDLTAVLKDWDKNTPLVFAREVAVKDRVLGETIQVVPEFRVARIYARDITARKLAENRITGFTKLYAVLSRVNETIVRTHDENTLFREVCKILAEEGGFPLVWIGLVDRQQVVSVASCGPATNYLKEIRVEVGGKLGRGPTGTCVRENRPVINDDFATNPAVSPWHEAATRYGFHASAAFPFCRFGQAIGAFTIYASEPKAFDAEQVRLLESLSADISYALDALEQEKLRVQSEANLTRVKETWERTFASVPDLIAILDNSHRILQVNEPMARRLGKTADECIGLPCFKTVHGLSAPPFFGPHSRTIKDGKQHVEEIHDERLNSDFEISTTPIYDDQGQMTGSVHVVHDITERKQADASIRRSLERFALLAETAGELLKAPDLRRAVESVAARVMEHLDCQAFFNFIIDDGAGRLRLNAYAGIPEEEGAKIEWLDYGVAVCGCAARDNCRIVAEHIPTTPDNRTELVKSYGIKAYAAHPLQGPRGKVLGTLSFGTRSRETFSDDDLSLMRAVADQVTTAMVRMQAEEAVKTARDELEERVQQRTAELSDAYDELRAEEEERKKTEEQLRQAHKMEAIGTLAGGIAHDFNNILAAIMGFTEMVIEDLPEGSQEEKNLRYVLKSAHRGKDLVKQILAFSRKSDYVRGSMSLAPLIKETIHLLRASIPTTIEIVFKATAIEDTVLASPTEMQQILMNLATNAALAMEDKGGTLEIILNDIDFQPDAPAIDLGIEPGEYLQLAVKDAGSGMTPEVMKRVFEPFFTTREVGKGTGMGLAMVYGIVTDLRGTITVESEPGVGSIFRLFLPKVKSEMTTESLKAADDDPRGKERILFLDDEELLVEWGRAALTRLGYKVTSMTDSVDALKTFSSDPSQFDLIITDQTMPGLTGMQLAQKLLKIRPDIPIILCTGHSETVTLEDVQAAEIRELLMKPVNKTKIARTIRSVLDQKSKE